WQVPAVRAAPILPAARRSVRHKPHRTRLTNDGCNYAPLPRPAENLASASIFRHAGGRPEATVLTPRRQVPKIPAVQLQAPLAQLDRAMAYGAIGWGFESLGA